MPPQSSPTLSYMVRALWRGESVARAYMNWETQQHVLEGEVLDVGAGRTLDYHRMQRSLHAHVQGVDGKVQDGTSHIDFERDPLPHADSTFDMVLMYNVLEHIFAHEHLLCECNRVLKARGSLIGFVPFLVRYHADPHDYFRYTHEALHKLLEQAGFTNIGVLPIGGAMFAVQFQSMALSLPVALRVALYPLYHLVDKLYLLRKPEARSWYPLGYFFVVKKKSEKGTAEENPL